MNYCSECGQPVSLQIPQGDNRERCVCRHCGQIHYENPKIVTGCLPLWNDRVLLCKRAIEPRRGLWTLPAGFMENGESMQQGAIRETREEACARIEIKQLYTLFNLPQINQVYVFFIGSLIDENFAPGEESLETALFDEPQIPWEHLAFAVVRETLSHFFADRKNGNFIARVGDIHWQDSARSIYEVEMLGA